MTTSDIAIVAARRPIGVPLQAVLRDWTALSLVRPVLFVDLDALLADGSLPVVVLADGASRPGLLQQELGRRALSVARFCAVSLVDVPDGPIDAATVVKVASAIRDAVPSATLVQAHLVVGSPAQEWASRMPALLGWHNLALSPEESQAPDRGASSLARSSDDPRWLFSVTGTLCSLLGLWPGQNEGVLDGLRPPSSAQVTPVRSYTRSLSADAVEQSLAERLLAFGEHYPAPRVDAGTAVVVDDEAAVAVGMADALLAKHADVLPRERVTPPEPPAQRIGFMQALKQFFAFMGATIRNAPRALAESLVRSASATAARVTQNLVYGGSNSNMAVVVRGVRADGSPASWVSYEEHLDTVIRQLGEGGGADLAPVPQKPQLWTDFVDGALTLLDAGSRSHDLQPRTVGTQRAIVSSTTRVAPNPTDTFRLPPHLAAFMSAWEIEPYDDVDANRLYEELPQRLATQSHLALDVSSERQRLKEWSSARRESYVGRLGHRLGNAHRGLVKEIEQLRENLRALEAAATLPDDIGKEQEALSKRLKVLALVAIVLVVVFGVLLGLGILTMMWGIIAIVVTLLGWLFGGTAMYLRGQARLYAFLHRQSLRESKLATARRHLYEAFEDLRRLTRLYRQYLDWSRALGAFLHSPLGKPVVDTVDEVVVGQGLPRNIGVGVALPDAEAIDEVANGWRQQLFRVGWLSDAWNEYLRDVPPAMGGLRRRIATEPGVLLSDQALDSEGSVLTRWSRAVATEAPQRPASESFLGRLQELTESDDGARERLLSRVMVRDGVTGVLREESRRDFNDGLDRDYAGMPLTFLGEMFSPYSTAVDVRVVRDRVLQVQSRGLASAMVLAQFGGSYDPSQFASGQAEATVAAEPPTPMASAPSTQPDWI